MAKRNCRKSTTWPCSRRSMTLPSAPPMIIVTAKQNSFCVGWLRIIQTMKAEAARPRPTKNQRCQPEAPARKEKAAPVLCTRTRLKKSVTRRLSPSVKLAMTSVLVSWSSTITSAARPSHSPRPGPPPAPRAPLPSTAAPPPDLPPLPAPAIRPPRAPRRRRRGCGCSGRRSSGAPGHGRRRRASASSARTCARSRVVPRCAVPHRRLRGGPAPPR